MVFRYISDAGGIRRVDQQGIINTVVPDCNGPMTTDSSGRVIVYCGRILRIEPSGTATFLGTIGLGSFSGDGGPAEQAGVGFVSGIVADRSGNLYLFDAQNRRVRVIKAVISP